MTGTYVSALIDKTRLDKLGASLQAQIDALTMDRARLDWIMPMVASSTDSHESDSRIIAMAYAMGRGGKVGREAIDYAMQMEREAALALAS